MERGGNSIYWVLAILGGAAAVATIYQVFFQKAAPVVIESHAPPAGARAWDVKRDLDAIIAVSAADGVVVNANGALNTAKEGAEPLEGVNIGIASFKDGALQDFAVNTFGYVKPVSYLSLRLPKITGGEQIVVCVAAKADGAVQQVVELRDVPAAADIDVLQLAASRAPIASSPSLVGCDDVAALQTAYNELTSR